MVAAIWAGGVEAQPVSASATKDTEAANFFTALTPLLTSFFSRAGGVGRSAGNVNNMAQSFVELSAAYAAR
jgi:hypothetical protein